jgi:hypothetical protein
MRSMKLPRFSLRTLLLSTAAIALTLWGLIEWHSVQAISVGAGGEYALLHELRDFFSDSLVWVPFIFAAYSIGRKSLTIPALIVFAVAEACAVGFWRWIFS